MNRYRAVLAYDGTAYRGFQRLTDDRPSIQGAVEAALSRIAGNPIAVTAAGRTDAGVHATGQVIAFDMAWRHSEHELLRALNANLPMDIAAQRLESAAPDFHPRYAASSRAYEYRVYEAPVRVPVLDRLAWHSRAALDMARMNEAAALLVGAHDLASFGTPPLGERGTTRRRVIAAGWHEAAPLFGMRMLVFCIEADAFLYRMVRTIVGTLVEVGQGRLSIQDFDEAFRACDRTRIKFLAPAHGLTLVEVKYERETPAGV